MHLLRLLLIQVEELMERYFAGEEFTYEEVSTALRTHVMDCQIVPVLVGSGVHNQVQVC